MRVVGRWKSATDERTLIAGIVCIVVIVAIELAVLIAQNINIIIVRGETAPIKIVRIVTMVKNTVVSSIVENVKTSIAMVAVLRL